MFDGGREFRGYEGEAASLLSLLRCNLLASPEGLPWVCAWLLGTVLQSSACCVPAHNVTERVRVHVCVPQLLAAHVHAAMVMDEASRVIQGLLPGSQRIARARMASAVLRLALGRRKATR